MDVKTAGRTAELFEAFAQARQPLTLSELARALGALQSSIFNLLRVLYGAKNTDSQQLLPAVIWMSRSTLLARYGAHRRNTRNTAKSVQP